MSERRASQRNRRSSLPIAAGNSRMFRIIVLVIVVLLAFLVFRHRNQSMQYTSYSVLWENAELGSGEADYQEFNGTILKLTRDGVTCIENSGAPVWSYGYSMRSPKAVVRGKYGAIADIQSNKAVIFNEMGPIGNITTTLPILNLTISEYGVLALVLDDADSDSVTFYDNTGAALDIRIKTRLAGDGFPLDVSLSPKGTGLASSVVYLDQNSIQSQIVFYDFDIEQSNSDHIVGYFPYGDTMFPDVEYLTNSVAAAFGDDQINLFSLKDETKPAVIRSIPSQGEIYSVLYDETQVGMICTAADSSRMLQVYDLEGRLKYQHPVDFDYHSASFSNGNAVVCGSTECMIVGSKGSIRYKGTLECVIRDVVCTGDNTCLVMGTGSMKKIRFR